MKTILITSIAAEAFAMALSNPAFIVEPLEDGAFAVLSLVPTP